MSESLYITDFFTLYLSMPDRLRCPGVIRGNEPLGVCSTGGRFLMIFLIDYRSFLLVFGRP